MWQTELVEQPPVMAGVSVREVTCMTVGVPDLADAGASG